MGAFALYRRGRNPWLLVAGGGAIIVAACAVLVVSGWVEHDLFGLGFALVIAGLTIVEKAGQLPSSSALVALGGASYTLYLIHVPVMGAVLKIGRRINLTTIAPSAVCWWLVYATTVAIAYLSWLALEKPLQLALRFGSPTPVLTQAQPPP